MSIIDLIDKHMQRENPIDGIGPFLCEYGAKHGVEVDEETIQQARAWLEDLEYRTINGSGSAEPVGILGSWDDTPRSR